MSFSTKITKIGSNLKVCSQSHNGINGGHPLRPAVHPPYRRALLARETVETRSAIILSAQLFYVCFICSLYSAQKERDKQMMAPLSFFRFLMYGIVFVCVLFWCIRDMSGCYLNCLNLNAKNINLNNKDLDNCVIYTGVTEKVVMPLNLSDKTEF